MTDPAYKTYTDKYFVTKESFEKRIEIVVGALGDRLGFFLKQRDDRIAELEAFVRLQRAAAAAQDLSNRRPDLKAISGGRS